MLEDRSLAESNGHFICKLPLFTIQDLFQCPRRFLAFRERSSGGQMDPDRCPVLPILGPGRPLRHD
jgi:hypothetical protein